MDHNENIKPEVEQLIKLGEKREKLQLEAKLIEEEKGFLDNNLLLTKWHELHSEIQSILFEERILISKGFYRPSKKTTNSQDSKKSRKTETGFKKTWDNILGIIGLVIIVFFIRTCTGDSPSGGSGEATRMVCINPESGRRSTLNLNRDGDRVTSTRGSSASGLGNTNLSYALAKMHEQGYACRPY